VEDLQMPMVILLCEPGSEPRISPALAARLADFGVTGLTVLRDHTLTGLALEGWAFNPSSAAAAAELLAADGITGRLLQPVVTLAVSPATTKEGSHR
jgi:hypothetical protein